MNILTETRNNEIDYNLIDSILKADENNASNSSKVSWSYDEIKSRKFKTILPSDFYFDYDKDGIFTNASNI